MKYSNLFAKTVKTDARDEEAINAKYLLKAAFVDKLMAGSFTLLPLGLRVMKKIEQIIREEMNSIGAQEILMPLLHPKHIWNETGRWESAREVMYQFKKNEKEYALSFTHEEIVMDLIRKHVASYKDFPVKIYHFSTKFRDELRAKAGILRGREFLMKDLYSAHVSQKNMMDYYWQVADAYVRIFHRLDLSVKIAEASGGVFTNEFTHEFQVLSPGGEDTLYYCTECKFAQNKEVFTGKENDICSLCHKGKIIVGSSIEVGNIFPLGTRYSEKMNALFTDRDGTKKPIWLASYGIGLTRLIGTLVEVHHDERGIIWPKAVAPYQVVLINLKKNLQTSNEFYAILKKKSIDVLYDDREDVGPGQKFADADLIGIPVRLVISEKTGDKIEYKRRDAQEIHLLAAEELFTKLS